MDNKGGPFARHGLNNHSPVVVLCDNKVGDGEAQACPRSFLFGGEKWFENPSPDLFGHAAPVILNLRTDKALLFFQAKYQPGGSAVRIPPAHGLGSIFKNI